MAIRPLPDQATLLKMLRYEPETGKLFWRERTPDLFAHCKYPESNCRKFNATFAGKETFTADNGKGYRVGTANRFGQMKAHRVVWCMHNGTWPEQIDHIDQDPTNNRIENLRETDRVGNARNCLMSVRNRSGRTGVHWSSLNRRWRAKIRHNGRYIQLGDFRIFEDACRAREAAEKKYGYSPLHGRKV